MKYYFLLAMLVASTLSNAAGNVRVYEEKTTLGYNIYADNEEYSPVSVLLDLKIENMVSRNGKHKVFIIPANSKKVLLTSLSILKKNKKPSLSYKTAIAIGNHNLRSYDNDFRYYLPYDEGQEFTVYQGYKSNFSERGESAIDFDMPVGTPVAAARAGVVTKVITSNKKGCNKERCKRYTNLITIYHEDGTFADYYNLSQNGAKVKVGEKIKEGQVIALSGNTGFTDRPHLRFLVYIPRLKEKQTVKTKFKTGDGDHFEYLKTTVAYTRNY